MVNNGEPWANAELYVTAFNGCEKFAARNQAPYLDPALTCSASTAKDLTTMVNGENVNGKDLVVWYALRHHHIVRDEDQAMMPIEWTGFEMEPRSFAASNPAP
jgi:primary-amine oxidase